MKSLPKSFKGFTLIEVMVVTAIIAIIAGIAIPSYQESVRRANRTDALVELNGIAQRLQRCYTTYSAYNNDNCGAATQLADGGTRQSEKGWYEISGVIAAQTYSLTARPVVGGKQAKDTKCTSFTFTNTGVKSATGDDPDRCW